MASEAESLWCVGARSSVELTREVTILSGKDQGQRTQQTVLYPSSLEMAPQKAASLLANVRKYWTVKGGLHQRLAVTAREDTSRASDLNSHLVRHPAPQHPRHL